MEKHIPMYGTISHNGGNYTLSMKKQGSCSNITLTGYDKSVFDGFSGPVIRFDLAPLDAVLDWLKGPSLCVKGHGSESFHSQDEIFTLDEYLDRARSFNIPVDQWEA